MSTLTDALSAVVDAFRQPTPDPVEYHYTKQAGGSWQLRSLNTALSYGGVVPAKEDILIHKDKGGERYAFRVTRSSRGGGNDAHIIRLEQIGHVEEVDLPPAKETPTPRTLV